MIYLNNQLVNARLFFNKAKCIFLLKNTTVFKKIEFLYLLFDCFVRDHVQHYGTKQFDVLI